VAADWGVEVGLVMVIFNESIVETLVIAFQVIVLGEFFHGVTEMAFAYRNNLAEAL
jgi:hypothetical protein